MGRGTVAENITVCRSGGVDERIFSISSRKPMFSISSASSRMTVLIPPSCRVLRSMWSMTRPGVPMMTLAPARSPENCRS